MLTTPLESIAFGIEVILVGLCGDGARVAIHTTSFSLADVLCGG